MRKLLALILSLFCAASPGAGTDAALQAVLTFASFSGGGPEISVTVEDPTLVSWESSLVYDTPEGEPAPPGAGYREIYTFTGLKPGVTVMTVRSGSAIVPETSTRYAVLVDEHLSVFLRQVRPLRSFTLIRGGMMRPRTDTVYVLEGTGYLNRDWDSAMAISPDTLTQLEDAIAAWNVAAWDGFNESDPYVLDGEDFSLSITFADGGTVSAYGSNAFPEGYFDFAGRVREVLDSTGLSGGVSPAGTYRYAGEGFGSDFTLTLLADGTFTYTEGALSSYFGTGTWSQEGAILLLTDSDNNWYYMIPTENALYYQAADSDSFRHVQVPDQGRFDRTEPTDETMQEEYMNSLVKSTPTLVIEGNGHRFYAALEDNSSAQALVEKLSGGPVEVAASDYGSFEKVGPLPWALPTNDEQITTMPGDVILYQGDQITVYYAQNSWRFTRLARIGNVTREELLAAFGEGDVDLRFWLEWPE